MGKTITELTPQEQIYYKLKQRGYSDNSIAGILGNIDVETGGTFIHTQKQKGGRGHGLFQLDPKGPLYPAYNRYLRKTKQPDSADAQLNFMTETIYGPKSYQKIIGEGNAARLRKVFAEGTPERVAKEFQDIWERPGTPHEERRIASATKFREKYIESDQPFNLEYISNAIEQPMPIPRPRPEPLPPLASDLVARPAARQEEDGVMDYILRAISGVRDYFGIN